MEFLTKIIAFGNPCIYTSSATYDEVVQKLGEYETIGFSPKDISARLNSGGWWIKRYEDLFICSRCNGKNNTNSKFCPECGCEMNAPMQLENIIPAPSNSIMTDVVTSDYVETKINTETVRIAVDNEGNPVDYAMYEGDRVVEVPASWKVHRGHCCILHGCKYGDADCPVTLGKVKQNYLCYDCTDDYYGDRETNWRDIHRAYNNKLNGGQQQ